MSSFNYTGRKKINQSDVYIDISYEKEDVIRVNADVDLTSYKLPSGATIYIEAYYLGYWERFNYGKIGGKVTSSDMALYQSVDIEDIKFRVKVIDDGGMILAMADKIKPTNEDHHDAHVESLLPVRNADLKGALWRLDYADDLPTLVINSFFGNKYEVMSNNEYASLIFPNAVREILIRIYLVEGEFDFDDSTDWQSQWVKFIKPFSSEKMPNINDTRDEIYEWIDDVVARFCRQNELLSPFSVDKD